MNTQRIIKNFIYTVAGGILSLGPTAVATKRKRQTVFPLWKPSFPTLHPSTVQPLLWFGTEKLQKLKSTVC